MEIIMVLIFAGVIFLTSIGEILNGDTKQGWIYCLGSLAVIVIILALIGNGMIK